MALRGAKVSESAPTNGLCVEGDSRLHEAAFHGDLSSVVEMLKRGVMEPCAQDKHGETPDYSFKESL